MANWLALSAPILHALARVSHHFGSQTLVCTQGSLAINQSRAAKTCSQKRITTPFRRRRAFPPAWHRQEQVTGAPGKVVRLAALRVVNQTHGEVVGHVGELEMAGVRPEVRLR
jgi:hypothetical protein